MKTTLMKILLITLMALFYVPATQADVSVGVTVGEPGFYGRIVLGDGYPAPVLMYPDPVVIDHGHAPGRPLYLHVPPGHAKDWRKHCKHYDACGHPVYFVQESWYANIYVPSYRDRHSHNGKSNGQGNGQGNNRGRNNGRGNR